MPSIFSRSRTNSTPKKSSLIPDDTYNLGAFDEFGRVSSRLSNRPFSPSTPSKKDKKKGKGHSSREAEAELSAELPFPDGTFLPLNLERPRTGTTAAEHFKEHDYGYLSYERHVVLGLDQVTQLVDVVSEELESRGGITTPFIFSTTALDISSSAIKRLIRSFINTCAATTSNAGQEADRKWREEAKFAGPHELGMCLRWGLARVIRSVAGQDVRGLVSWDHYVEFRDSEAANGYPPAHFISLLPDLPHPLQSIIVRLFTLLSRIVANSTTSGHTPPTLSPLFGPLLFGLGPATLAFHHAYIHYLRSVTAMDHLLLAFIRWQDTPRLTASAGASATGLGVPIRLKEWIKGYPSMLPFLEQKNARPQPRKGARTVRVMSVRRNVRIYSPDLVKTASTWAHRDAHSNVSNGLASSKEWDRIAPATLKLPPRYSDAYKKRMDLPPNFHPDTAPGAAYAPAGMNPQPTSSYSSATSATSGTSFESDGDYFGLSGRDGDDRFRSLTDLKWGEFESMGFSGLGDEKKLQFDLTETARVERAQKRQTLSWTDFSSAGFTRMDAPLSATLQFSTPLNQTISTWPAQNAEINKKLKKSQKSLPAFGWDTEPVIGSEEVIEEAFVDVFCDLVYGGGWMDLERGEQLDRDCNWALVEYKSLPPSRTTASGTSDPRVSTTLILFEEFVPLEYRQQLAVKSSSRRRLPSLFSASSKSKQWKQAPTLNGRPYVVGHVPRSPSYREVEFEGLLHGGSTTKLISLNKTPRITSTISNAPSEFPALSPTISRGPPLLAPETENIPTARSDDVNSDSTHSHTPSHRKSRFRLPGGIPVPSPGSHRKSGMIPAEYSTVEFQTRMASYSDDEWTGDLQEPEDVKQKRRESRADAWVDILVESQDQRMGGQDAELSPGERRKAAKNRRSDPEMASMEVAQVLAAVQNRSPSPPSVMERVDRDYGIDQHIYDLDVDEVEIVPRTSESRTAETDNSSINEEPRHPIQVIVDEEPVIEPILSARQMARQQRRLGYFDLHPERKQALAAKTEEEDDPRALLGKDESDEEDDEGIYGSPDRIRPLPVPPVAAVPHATIYEPSPVAHSLKTAGDLSQIEHNALEHKRSGNFGTPEKTLPAHNGNGLHVEPTSPAPSKTAALIEMYRERERGTPPRPSLPSVPIVVAPLAPSRLPRPLQNENLTPPQPQVQPTTISPQPSPKPSPQETSLIDLPHVTLDETGRSSPARYVHGAPLHNVLEEEEEEI